MTVGNTYRSRAGMSAGVLPGRNGALLPKPLPRYGDDVTPDQESESLLHALAGSARRAARAVGTGRLRAVGRMTLVLAMVPAQLAVGGTLAYQMAFAERIYPGIAVADVNVSGLRREEAVVQLQGHVTSLAERPVRLRFQEQEFRVSLGEMGLVAPKADLDHTVEQAWHTARAGQLDLTGSSVLTGDVLEWLRDQVALQRYGERLALPLTLDPGTTREALRRIAQQVDRPVVNARLEIARSAIGFEPRLTSPQAGRALDVEATLAAFSQHFQQAVASGTYPSSVDLVVRVVEPQAPEMDVNTAYEMVTQLLAAPLVFTGPDDQTWRIEPEELLQTLAQPVENEAVVSSVEIDETNLRNLVTGAVGTAGERPQNARLLVQGDHLTIDPGVHGWHADLDAAAQLAMERISSPDRTVPLPIVQEAPVIDEEALAPVRDWANDRLAAPMNLTYNGHTWTLRGQDLIGFLALPETRISEATHPPGTIALDEANVRNFVIGWVIPWTGLDPAKAGMDAGLEVHGRRVAIRPSRYGQTVDVDRLVADLTAGFQSLDPATRRVTVHLVTRAPRVTEGSFVAARDRANMLISAPIVIRSPLGQDRVLGVDQLLSMLRLPAHPGEMPSLARGPLTTYVEDLAKEMESRVQFTSGIGNASGIATVDVDKTVDAILAQAETSDRTVEITFQM